MDNDKYRRITLAGIVAGIVFNKFKERMTKGDGTDLEQLLCLRFTEAVPIHEIYSHNKDLTDMEWKYLCSVVATYMESYATMFSAEHTCSVIGRKSQNTLMFDFVFEKTQPKKLTVEEVEKLLGYKVEIIS